MKNSNLSFSSLFILLLSMLPLLSMAQDPVTFEPAYPNLTFNFPAEIQNAADGSNRMFVVEQSGKIKVFQNDAATTSQKTFLDVSNIISFSTGQEIGLLGLAFHPNYTQNGLFFIYHTRASSVSGIGVELVLARYKVSDTDRDAAARDPQADRRRRRATRHPDRIAHAL